MRWCSDDVVRMLCVIVCGFVLGFVLLCDVEMELGVIVFGKVVCVLV